MAAKAMPTGRRVVDPFADQKYRYGALLKTGPGLADGVVDGDTVDLVIDLGMSVKVDLRVRLDGSNAPEHGTPEGDAATGAVRAWVAAHPGPYLVRTRKDKREKFGRLLATIVAPDGAELVEDMKAQGHIADWDGQGSRPLPPLPTPPPR